MAKIGLNNFRYSVASVDESTGAITYGTPTKPAKAISFSFEPTVADAKLYADDGLAESDSRVTGGSVTMGIDREDLQTQCDMLGHTLGVDGEVVDNVDDVAPYVGVGRVTKLMVDGAIKYRGTVLALVKFNEPSESDQTQGENVEFSTTELSGNVVVPEDGNWRFRKIFDTKSEAIAYIEGILGGTSGTTYTVTLNYGTGSGTPASITANANQIVSLPNANAITPPSGKHFIGWDTTSSSTRADIGTSYLVTGNVTLYAIYANN